MSLAKKTARSAALTIASGIGARAIGVIGTLVLTRYLAPEVVGEVSAAAIIVMSANWVTIWGFGQYLIVKGRGEEAGEVTWHCTVASLVLGGFGLGLVALFGGYLTPYVDAPDAAVFIPGMALAIGIRRFASIPEKLLVREMRFRPIAAATIAGESTYAGVAVLLAANGWGGEAIVVANVAQSSIMAAILIAAARWRSWMTPTPLRWARFRDMARFGLPLAVESIAHNASRYWDNLMMARYFGTGSMGLYNMAYNLADIPATQVGEQIAQALLPSMAQLPPERRPRALERATALLSLIIFPMAVGLGAVADPLIAIVLSEEWQGVAPLLLVLSVVSVFRPITWVLSTYLEAQGRTGRLMFLELGNVALLLAGIAVLAPYGIRAAATAVGFAYGFNAIAGIWMVVRDGPSPWRLALGFLQPAAACAVMAAAVWSADGMLVAAGVDAPAALLAIEIAVGGIVYVAAALILARPAALDLISVVRGMRARS